MDTLLHGAKSFTDDPALENEIKGRMVEIMFCVVANRSRGVDERQGTKH